MSREEGSFPVDRGTVRVPFGEEIALEFPGLAEFVREYGANISLGGLFIRTRSPRPVGTLFRFRSRLADGFTVIEGTAEVVWVRAQDEGEERPEGMGARFLDLPRESRDLIFRIVDRHIQKGGEPFDLERPPMAGEPGAR